MFVIKAPCATRRYEYKGCGVLGSKFSSLQCWAPASDQLVAPALVIDHTRQSASVTASVTITRNLRGLIQSDYIVFASAMQAHMGRGETLSLIHI